MKKILIIEDEEVIREELAFFLKGNDFEVEVVEDFSHTGEMMEKSNADMILLDICLPGINGQTLLKTFRKNNKTPVIMLTSKNTDMDELICMSYGADDFISKPYNPAILLLHIEAVFRRIGNDNDESIIKYGQIMFDTSKSVLNVNGETIDLSKNEMGILYFLIKNKGKIVSREEIMGHLWDSCEFVDDNTLTVNITRIRHKLEDAGLTDVIKTKRGQGYYIEV